MNLRRRNNIEKGLRDYMVPIVGGLLLILLIVSLFSGGNDTTKIDVENKVGFSVTLNGANSESYIVYPGDYKKKIEGDISLYKGEKLIVKDGYVDLSLPGTGEFKVDKLGEFKYGEDGNFYLYSSDLWLNSTSAINLDMRFLKVRIGENSHLSFSQNEMTSTVYLLSGFAEVTNLVGDNTVLGPGQKITISRLDASKQGLDLSLLRENIDDFFKQSDWFILNNGSSYIKSESITSSGSTQTSSGNTLSSGNSSGILTFSNLYDESNVSSDKISIAGNYFDDTISSITVNGKEATINSDLKTFKFDNVSVPNKENNLVFKVFDDTDELVSKFVYTIYYEGGSSASNSANSTNTGGGSFNVKTFDVDGSKFTFTQPTTGDTYTSTEDFITIRGAVLTQGISKVTVNDYTLNSFNGSTWRYHASTSNNNLSDGTNIYEVKYFDGDGNMVYKNYYTIIRKVTSTKTEDTTVTDTQAQ